MMTRPKRWSTTDGSGWSQGSSLVVQVSGGALARTSSVAPSIKIKSKIFRGNRVDTIFGAGLIALLFFFEIFDFQDTLEKISSNAVRMTSSANLIQHSFE